MSHTGARKGSPVTRWRPSPLATLAAHHLSRGSLVKIYGKSGSLNRFHSPSRAMRSGPRQTLPAGRTPETSIHPTMHGDALPPILVVDDNPTDVFFLCRRLASAGIANPLTHLEDGMAATQWLEAACLDEMPEAARPALMFLDLKMPRLDGFEVLTWMQRRALTNRLTVVVLTTSNEPADMERAARLGAHAFLVKYPRVEQLLRVQALAAQRSARIVPAPMA